MASLPTQRSLKELRKRGYLAAVVERWNQYAKIRQDLFGCIDIVAVHPIHGTIGVQATSGTNRLSRVSKLRAEPNVEKLKAAGWEVSVWTWHPHKVKRGGKDLLTTQLYIKGHPGNEKDGIWKTITEPRQRDAITVDFAPLKGAKAGELAAHFDLVLGLTPEA